MLPFSTIHLPLLATHQSSPTSLGHCRPVQQLLGLPWRGSSHQPDGGFMEVQPSGKLVTFVIANIHMIFNIIVRLKFDACMSFLPYKLVVELGTNFIV